MLCHSQSRRASHATAAALKGSTTASCCHCNGLEGAYQRHLCALWQPHHLCPPRVAPNVKEEAELQALQDSHEALRRVKGHPNGPVNAGVPEPGGAGAAPTANRRRGRLKTEDYIWRPLLSKAEQKAHQKSWNKDVRPIAAFDVGSKTITEAVIRNQFGWFEAKMQSGILARHLQQQQNHNILQSTSVKTQNRLREVDAAAQQGTGAAVRNQGMDIKEIKQRELQLRIATIKSEVT